MCPSKAAKLTGVKREDFLDCSAELEILNTGQPNCYCLVQNEKQEKINNFAGDISNETA